MKRTILLSTMFAASFMVQAQEVPTTTGSVLYLNFDGDSPTDLSTNAATPLDNTGAMIDGIYEMSEDEMLSYDLAEYPSMKLGEDGDFAVSVRFFLDTAWRSTLTDVAYITMVEISDRLFLRFFGNGSGAFRCQLGAYNNTTEDFSYGYFILDFNAFNIDGPVNGFNDGAWNTLTFVYDNMANGTEAGLYAYVNEYLVPMEKLSVESFGLGVDYSGSEDSKAKIGIDNTVPVKRFQGAIDFAVFYDDIPSDDDIHDIHYQGVLSNKKQTLVDFASVFPNPSKGSIKLQSAQEIVSYALYNAMGQLVEQNAVANNAIDLEAGSGVYSIVLMAKNGKTCTKKLVIE